MRIVLDTNVLVSGLLNPDGAPGRLLDLILGGRLQILYDDRILGEYSDVLARPQFGFRQEFNRLVYSGKRLLIGIGCYPECYLLSGRRLRGPLSIDHAGQHFSDYLE